MSPTVCPGLVCLLSVWSIFGGRWRHWSVGRTGAGGGGGGGTVEGRQVTHTGTSRLDTHCHLKTDLSGIGC